MLFLVVFFVFPSASCIFGVHDKTYTIINNNDDETIEKDWDAWKSALSIKLDSFIPKRKPRKFVVPPWIDGEVNHAIRKKNSLWSRAKRNGNGAIWGTFREKSRDVKYLIYKIQTCGLPKIYLGVMFF